MLHVIQNSSYIEIEITGHNIKSSQAHDNTSVLKLTGNIKSNIYYIFFSLYSLLFKMLLQFPPLIIVLKNDDNYWNLPAINL